MSERERMIMDGDKEGKREKKKSEKVRKTREGKRGLGRHNNEKGKRNKWKE